MASEQLWLWHPDSTIGSETSPIPKSKLVFREESKNERDADYRPWGTGLFKCLHGKTYFGECRVCKRTFAEGQKNLANAIAKNTP